MAQDTLLGFPAHTLPYRCGEFTTLSTVSLPPVSRRESQRIEKTFRPAAAARIFRAAVSMGSEPLTRPADGSAS